MLLLQQPEDAIVVVDDSQYGECQVLEVDLNEEGDVVLTCVCNHIRKRVITIMTKRELVKALERFPDNADVVIKDYGSDDNLYIDITRVKYVDDKDDEYYNTILVK